MSEELLLICIGCHLLLTGAVYLAVAMKADRRQALAEAGIVLLLPGFWLWASPGFCTACGLCRTGLIPTS